MTPQAGICAEPNLHGYYLMFNVAAGHEDEVRHQLAGFPALCHQVAAEFAEADFTGLVAIGEGAWARLYPGERPAELAPFPTPGAGERQAVATPFDLFVQLRGNRLDVLHLAAQRLMARLGGHVMLAEEVMGFRNQDCRDLTGFVDGTENPQGDHRAEVALVAEGPFAGGSYLHVQRFVHNLAVWERVALKEQEDTIGRTKHANIEYASADKPLTAHVKRTNLKDPQGKTKEILRQSMPWATLERQGLYFIACCATPSHFTDMLRSMYEGDGQGHFDHLLRFTRAETGAAFFAPSETFLRREGL